MSNTFFLSNETLTDIGDTKKIIDDIITILKDEFNTDVIKGTIGYWINTIKENILLIELEYYSQRIDPSKIEDFEYVKTLPKKSIFGLWQIKFMLSMIGKIEKPTKNPNDILGGNY